MGFEYKIAFEVGDQAELQVIADKLVASVSPQREFVEVQVVVEADGINFCDFTKSAVSSIIFRKLIDTALIYSQVTIHEL